MSREEDTWQDLLNAGNDIMKSVNGALESGDFSRLNSQINRSVEQAKRNTVNRYQNQQPNQRQSSQYTQRQTPPQGRGSGYQAPPPPRMSRTPYRTPRSGVHININTGAGNGYYRQNPQQNIPRYTSENTSPKYELTPFVQTKVSKTDGNNKMVGGAIGTAIFGFSALSAMWDIIYYADWGDLLGVAILVGLAGWSFSTFLKGRKKKKLSEEFFKYANVAGNRTYIDIADLARICGETKENVLKNLKEMMQNGMLPQAMLDDRETTLMLTNDVYQAYLQNKEMQKEQAAEEAAKKKEEESLTEEEKEVRSILEEGNTYIQKIHDANDAIPDDVMSEKLDRLESIMRRIFEQVKNHPETAGNLRKLMEYYLPTIEKLLNAYISLDQQPEVGNNITQTKRQIEEVLDTVNDAFENLLDSMFSDMAWDISSDISVMQTMLKQDGLAGESITGKK